MLIKQLEQRSSICAKKSITLFELGYKYSAIVHVKKPKMDLTQLEMIKDCDASHTTTLGTFRAIAYGIGTCQVAQVFSI